MAFPRASGHGARRLRDCSPGELIADGVVHAVGIVIAIAAGSALLALAASRTGPGEYAAAIFYVSSLLAVFSISCAYNLCPRGPVKQALRRLDHAAIYLLIAGTYTPFLVQLEPVTARVMLAIVWGAAFLGMAVKLLLPGRFDRLAVGFYLAVGWSGVAVVGALAELLPASTIWLIAGGGIVYSLGVVFFAWRTLRYNSAVWHAFVVAGATLHLAAVADALVLARL